MIFINPGIKQCSSSGVLSLLEVRDIMPWGA